MTIAVMKQALECLESLAAEPPGVRALHPNAVVIQNLRAALAEAEQQEPVACLYRDSYGKLKVSQVWPPESGAFMVFTTPQPAIPDGMVVLFEKAIHHLKQHAAEYEHPGQHKLISDMEAMLAAAPKPGDKE